MSGLRIALFGGAFDPPHLAHVFTVTYLLSRQDVDEVWVIPTARHVFGKRMAPFEARVALLELALAGLDRARVRILDLELHREGPSRTYDTLEALELAHPEHRFVWVIGADNLAEAHRWYRFDELVARWPLVVLGRPGHETALAARAHEPWCRPGPTLPDASSTAVRAALVGGDPHDPALRWLPEGCLDQARRLYGPADIAGELPAVFILGAGRAGTALAAALAEAGVAVAGVWNRVPRSGATCSGPLPKSLGASTVWILAADDEGLPDLAARLAAHPAVSGEIVALHLAGRLDHHILAPLAAVGVETGSLHPLRALTGPGDDLRGTFCGVEGTPRAVAVAEGLARALGARPIAVPPGEKAAWHAAAVLAANFVVTLTEGGAQLLSAVGLDEATARRVLTPLQAGTVAHLARRPTAEALTGPFVRGDLAAVSAHLRALHAHAPTFVPVYRALAEATAALLGWDEARLAALALALA